MIGSRKVKYQKMFHVIAKCVYELIVHLKEIRKTRLKYRDKNYQDFKEA